MSKKDLGQIIWDQCYWRHLTVYPGHYKDLYFIFNLNHVVRIEADAQLTEGLGKVLLKGAYGLNYPFLDDMFDTIEWHSK